MGRASRSVASSSAATVARRLPRLAVPRGLHACKSLSSRLKVDAVAIARRPDPDGGDELALARITRERDRAALRFARDRDLGRLEATEARAYLESLPELWANTSDAGRHAIAEAVLERIDILGVTDYTFTLTAHAKARGWDAAFGAGVLRLQGQCGRGKTPSPNPASGEGVLSVKEGRSGRGERI